MISVDKVAKAIFDSRKYKTTYDILNTGMKNEYRIMARGAIAEMETEFNELQAKYDKLYEDFLEKCSRLTRISIMENIDVYTRLKDR